MKEVIGSKQAAEKLNKYFPEVAWDRFVSEGRDLSLDNQAFTLYGWLDREEDSYKDFVLVLFFWDGTFEYYTSSAKYSPIFNERINGPGQDHIDCERVEEFFPRITNLVRLKRSDDD